MLVFFFFFQAEDGIRDLVRSRGLGDVYKRQKKKFGFQVTFFRYATDLNSTNPSRFAAKDVVIAHLALSDPAADRLMHREKTAREAFDLAYSKQGNTDVRLDDWFLVREENGTYQVDMRTEDFGLQLSLRPTQKLMLKGCLL